MPEAVKADPRATLQMPERTRPLDAIGNELRKGQLVAFKAANDPIICRIADIVQAGTLHDADNNPMKLQGSVTFVLQIPYSEGGNLPMVLCLKEPEK